MAKYRNLRSMESINLVFFQPGMGGQFLSNLLNLADPGFVKADIKEYYRDTILLPIGSRYQDEERTLNFHSGKWFFRFIDSRSDDDDLDLWLTDIEIHTVKIMASHGNAENEHYYRQGKPTATHKRLHLPYHAPDDASPCDALSHVSDYAARFGIKLRYTLVTIDDQAVRRWAYRRAQDMEVAPPETYEHYEMRYRMRYEPVLQHPDAMELNMDGFARGDNGSLLDQMRSIVGEDLENLDLVSSRADAYRTNKMSGRL